jgi:plastocyanin
MLRTAIAAVVLTLLVTASRAQTVEIHASVTTDKGRAVEDAVVVAVPVDAAPDVAGKRPRRTVIDQVDKEFIPKVMVVQAGSAVLFPNHDNVRHHVYSFSPAKHFELPLYAGVPAEPVLFDRAGVVVLGCNIHDWMIGYVYVADSPWFAKTGKDGKAVLAVLPARSYVVRIWHPQLEGGEDATRRTIDASRARVVPVEWSVKLGCSTPAQPGLQGSSRDPSSRAACCNGARNRADMSSRRSGLPCRITLRPATQLPAVSRTRTAIEHSRTSVCCAANA